MKKKLLTLCAIVSISAMAIACGNTSDETEASGVEESAEVAEVDTQTDAAEAEVSEDTDDAAALGSSEEEGMYSVFTDATNAEVEAYADKVIKAALAKDWDTIGDMIEYPIGSKDQNNLCKNKEEFVAYANSTGFVDDFYTSLSAWDQSELWGNYMGACIDNGSIWFRDINPDKTEFKIVKFFDLAEEGGEITD